MANENGTRTPNVEKSATLDHYLGSKGGSTRLQTSEQMAQQLLASGPMRAALPISGSNTLYFATKAAMQAANLSSSAVALTLISAWVYADETVENNGVYKPLAGTPVTWQRVLDLPMQWAEAEQIAGTTANAIKAKTGVPVSRSLIVALPITAANTVAPTVSFNGGAALSIVSNNDNPVAAGGLVPPMLIWGFADYDASKFRLINDQVASAIVAAAEAAANSAKGYRDAAQVLKLQAAQSALDAKHYAEQAEESSTGSIEAALDAAPLMTAAAATDKFFVLVDGALKAITKASLGKLFGSPVGQTIMMQGNGNTPPPGYLLHNGAPCTSAYPELRAFLLANGATVNGNGDPIIEDMGGYFPRGWRPGQVVDSGRVFGSSQQDQFQNHRHPANRVTNATVSAVVNNNQQGPVFYIADGYVNTPQTYASAHGANLPDGDSGTPRTGAETRPSNKTFTFWIKAYAADQSVGSADLAALTNNVQSQAARISALETKFVSAPQSIVFNSTVTIAHGLGAIPSRLDLFLECVTTEAGYNPGERLPVGFHFNGFSETGRGVQIYASTTNIIIVSGVNAVWALSAASRVQFQITPANWRYIAVAKV